MNKRKCYFPQEMGPDRLKIAQPWCLMIFWLCTAFQIHCFTSFRIPNMVVCISIACSNGYGFIRVGLQVCSLAYKTFKSKKTRQLPIICTSGTLSAVHVPAALLVTPQTHAILKSSPQKPLSFRLILTGFREAQTSYSQMLQPRWN